MKLLHIADLHFGKTLHECSLVEKDQPFWKNKFIELVDEVKPDAVLIAGDVYDRSTPSNEAVKLLDEMITDLSQRDITVFMVSGNHDSGQKLSFGNQIFEKHNIFIAGTLKKELMHFTLNDEYGPVTFWLMPYIFPALVSSVLDDKSIRDYETAIRKLLENQDIDFTQRNVIISHQNITANGVETERGGSETMIGGIGNIDYSVFDGFTYAALGHIHAAQPVGRREVRYAGSPLCYHFSETKQSKKGPVLVELKAVGEEPEITTHIIEPLHPMREIQGSFDEIMQQETKNEKRGEYIRIVLKDGQLRPDAAKKLRSLFESHGSVILEIVNEVHYSPVSAERVSESNKKKSTGELFADFFFERCEQTSPDEKETEIIDYLAAEVSEHAGEEKCGEPSEDDVDKFVKFIFRQEGI